MREDRGRTLWLVSDELMVRLLQAVEANGGADE
jgi:hypothetical protein